MQLDRPTVPWHLVGVIERGDNDALTAYLNEGKLREGDISRPTYSNAVVEGCPYGETLLHYAAWHGNEDAVALLVRHGANINAGGLHSGCLPLHSAAAGGHLGVVALLLSLGSSTVTVTTQGWSPLHSCCLRGHENVAWFLESQGMWMDHTTAEGQTARELLNRALAEKKKKATGLVASAPAKELLDGSGKLRIQIASDTHTEFYDSFQDIPELITPSAPILALLGDIGNPALPTYRDFIYHQAQRFELVLVVAGNHEFYTPRTAPPHPTLGELNQAIHEICAAAPRKNVLYLDKGVVELGGYTIMGCILWSHIADNQKQSVARSMNDYRLIFKSNRHNFTESDVFSPDDSVAQHNEQLEWLKNQIRVSMQKGKKAVVLTHHTPSYQVDGSGLAFSSSLEYLFRNKGSNVAVWAHGHTHYNDDRVIEGTRVVSNMVGYKHAPESSYRHDLVITVE